MYQALAKRGSSSRNPGYRSEQGPRAASEALAAHGVAGIRYRDGASRNAKDEWHVTNYDEDGRVVNSFRFDTEEDARRFTGDGPRSFKRMYPTIAAIVARQDVTFSTAIRPVEFPELVELAKTLMDTPKVVKAFRGDGRIGDFTPIGRGRIRLHAALFRRTEPLNSSHPVGTPVIDKAKNRFVVVGHETAEQTGGDPVTLLEPEGGGEIVRVIDHRNYRADVSKRNLQQLAQTLAHEIGHLVDWLPDKTLKRGNLLGRSQSLHDFLRHTFTAATARAATRHSTGGARKPLPSLSEATMKNHRIPTRKNRIPRTSRRKVSRSSTLERREIMREARRLAAEFVDTVRGALEEASMQKVT